MIKYSKYFTILSMLFCTFLVVDNFIEIKPVNLYGITITAGFPILVATYIINDCIVELYGIKAAKFTIWMTVLAQFFLYVMVQLACQLPPATGWDFDSAYNIVFSAAPKVALLGSIGFMIGAFTNAYTMSSLKTLWKGEHFKTRAFLSTVVGEFCDNTFYFIVAFYNILSRNEIISLIVCSALVKIVLESLVLPITHKVVNYIRNKEATESSCAV